MIVSKTSIQVSKIATSLLADPLICASWAKANILDPDSRDIDPCYWINALLLGLCTPHSVLDRLVHWIQI